MSSSSKVKTRILIISDTHGATPFTGPTSYQDIKSQLSQPGNQIAPTGFREPLPEADVVLHCGDLSYRSTLEEYQATFSMLRSLRAPLKLVIAGNHDTAMDEAYWRDVLGRETRVCKEVWEVVREARSDGVVYLDEGTHEFELQNGTKLKVYASQHTPEYGSWAFQYESGQHQFDIPPGMDVVMTHGPAHGVRDLAGTFYKVNAGCPNLFNSIWKARPKIHCFGHIHEGWGSVLCQWKSREGFGDRQVAAQEVFEQDDTRELLTEGIYWPRLMRENAETLKVKQDRVIEMSEKRGVEVDLTEGDTKLTPGEQTLFVNAAIMDIQYRPFQLPWIIDVDLDRSNQGS